MVVEDVKFNKDIIPNLNRQIRPLLQNHPYHPFMLTHDRSAIELGTMDRNRKEHICLEMPGWHHISHTYWCPAAGTFFSRHKPQLAVQGSYIFNIFSSNLLMWKSMDFHGNLTLRLLRISMYFLLSNRTETRNITKLESRGLGPTSCMWLRCLSYQAATLLFRLADSTFQRNRGWKMKLYHTKRVLEYTQYRICVYIILYIYNYIYITIYIYYTK